MRKNRPFKFFPLTGVLENMNKDSIDYDTPRGGDAHYQSKEKNPNLKPERHDF